MNPRKDNYDLLTKPLQLKYNRYYSSMINLGKSILFAQIYAEEMIDNEENDFASYCFAKAYTDFIEKGYSEEFSMQYAIKYQENMVDNYSNMIQVDSDPESIYFMDKAYGYAKGWEYANENKHKDIIAFAKRYEKVYINMVYATNIRCEIIDVDFDKQILDKISNSK
jgi:hypothetical protein